MNLRLSKQLSSREKILLIILAVLLVGALYYFFVQEPVTSGIQNAKDGISEAQMQSDILQVKYDQKMKMLNELEQIKAAGDPQLVPEYDNLEQIMAFLNRTLSGTQDFSISFDSLAPSKDSKVVRRSARMTFTCKGYAEAKSVVSDLENCPFLCRMTNLTMAPTKTVVVNGIIYKYEDLYGTSVYNIMNGSVQVSLTATFYERINAQA